MKTILCKFNGQQIKCKVTENMGYQGGDYVNKIINKTL